MATAKEGTSNGWSKETRELIAATVGKGLSKEGLAHLEHVSISKGLDPLANEIYAIPKGGKVTLIVSIGGMLKLCSSQLDGCESSWFDAQGNAHKIWLSNDAPAGCQVSVYRKGASRPFTSACRLNDYKASSPLWTKMPSRMLEKCTTAAALRLAFSDLLSGLYAQEEMDQAEPASSAPASVPTPDRPQAAEKPKPKRGTAQPMPKPAAPENLSEVVEAIDPQVKQELMNEVARLAENETDPDQQMRVLHAFRDAAGYGPEVEITPDLLVTKRHGALLREALDAELPF